MSAQKTLYQSQYNTILSQLSPQTITHSIVDTDQPQGNDGKLIVMDDGAIVDFFYIASLDPLIGGEKIRSFASKLTTIQYQRLLYYFIRFILHAFPTQNTTTVYSSGLDGYIKSIEASKKKSITTTSTEKSSTSSITTPLASSTAKKSASKPIPVDHSDSVLSQWINVLLFGQDHEEVLQRIVDASTIGSGVCGGVLKRGEPAYYCSTCSNDDPNCVICRFCFKHSNHEGHEIRVSESGGGICDCGNLEAWDQRGCCVFHQGPQTAPPPHTVLHPIVGKEAMETFVWPTLSVLVNAISTAFAPPTDEYRYLTNELLMNGLTGMSMPQNFNLSATPVLFSQSKTKFFEIDFYNQVMSLINSSNTTTVNSNNTLSNTDPVLFDCNFIPYFPPGSDPITPSSSPSQQQLSSPSSSSVDLSISSLPLPLETSNQKTSIFISGQRRGVVRLVDIMTTEEYHKYQQQQQQDPSLTKLLPKITPPQQNTSSKAMITTSSSTSSLYSLYIRLDKEKIDDPGILAKTMNLWFSKLASFPRLKSQTQVPSHPTQVTAAQTKKFIKQGYCCLLTSASLHYIIYAHLLIVSIQGAASITSLVYAQDSLHQEPLLHARSFTPKQIAKILEGNNGKCLQELSCSLPFNLISLQLTTKTPHFPDFWHYLLTFWLDEYSVDSKQVDSPVSTVEDGIKKFKAFILSFYNRERRRLQDEGATFSQETIDFFESFRTTDITDDLLFIQPPSDKNDDEIIIEDDTKDHKDTMNDDDIEPLQEEKKDNDDTSTPTPATTTPPITKLYPKLEINTTRFLAAQTAKTLPPGTTIVLSTLRITTVLKYLSKLIATAHPILQLISTVFSMPLVRIAQPNADGFDSYWSQRFIASDHHRKTLITSPLKSLTFAHLSPYITLPGEEWALYDIHGVTDVLEQRNRDQAIGLAQALEEQNKLESPNSNTTGDNTPSKQITFYENKPTTTTSGQLGIYGLDVQTYIPSPHITNGFPGSYQLDHSLIRNHYGSSQLPSVLSSPHEMNLQDDYQAHFTIADPYFQQAINNKVILEAYRQLTSPYTKPIIVTPSPVELDSTFKQSNEGLITDTNSMFKLPSEKLSLSQLAQHDLTKLTTINNVYAFPNPFTNKSHHEHRDEQHTIVPIYSNSPIATLLGAPEITPSFMRPLPLFSWGRYHDYLEQLPDIDSTTRTSIGNHKLIDDSSQNNHDPDLYPCYPLPPFNSSSPTYVRSTPNGVMSDLAPCDAALKQEFKLQSSSPIHDTLSFTYYPHLYLEYPYSGIPYNQREQNRQIRLNKLKESDKKKKVPSLSSTLQKQVIDADPIENRTLSLNLKSTAPFHSEHHDVLYSLFLKEDDTVDGSFRELLSHLTVTLFTDVFFKRVYIWSISKYTPSLIKPVASNEVDPSDSILSSDIQAISDYNGGWLAYTQQTFFSTQPYRLQQLWETAAPLLALKTGPALTEFKKNHNNNTPSQFLQHLIFQTSNTFSHMLKVPILSLMLCSNPQSLLSFLSICSMTERLSTISREYTASSVQESPLWDFDTTVSSYTVMLMKHLFNSISNLWADLQVREAFIEMDSVIGYDDTFDQYTLHEVILMKKMFQKDTELLTTTTTTPSSANTSMVAQYDCECQCTACDHQTIGCPYNYIRNIPCNSTISSTLGHPEPTIDPNRSVHMSYMCHCEWRMRFNTLLSSPNVLRHFFKLMQETDPETSFRAILASKLALNNQTGDSRHHHHQGSERDTRPKHAKTQLVSSPNSNSHHTHNINNTNSTAPKRIQINTERDIMTYPTAYLQEALAQYSLVEIRTFLLFYLRELRTKCNITSILSQALSSELLAYESKPQKPTTGPAALATRTEQKLIKKELLLIAAFSLFNTARDTLPVSQSFDQFFSLAANHPNAEQVEEYLIQCGYDSSQNQTFDHDKGLFVNIVDSVDVIDTSMDDNSEKTVVVDMKQREELKAEVIRKFHADQQDHMVGGSAVFPHTIDILQTDTNEHTMQNIDTGLDYKKLNYSNPLSILSKITYFGRNRQERDDAASQSHLAYSAFGGIMGAFTKDTPIEHFKLSISHSSLTPGCQNDKQNSTIFTTSEQPLNILPSLALFTSQISTTQSPKYAIRCTNVHLPDEDEEGLVTTHHDKIYPLEVPQQLAQITAQSTRPISSLYSPQNNSWYYHSTQSMDSLIFIRAAGSQIYARSGPWVADLAWYQNQRFLYSQQLETLFYNLQNMILTSSPDIFLSSLITKSGLKMYYSILPGPSKLSQFIPKLITFDEIPLTVHLNPPSPNNTLAPAQPRPEAATVAPDTLYYCYGLSQDFITQLRKAFLVVPVDRISKMAQNAIFITLSTLKLRRLTNSTNHIHKTLEYGRIDALQSFVQPKPYAKFMQSYKHHEFLPQRELRSVFFEITEPQSAAASSGSSSRDTPVSYKLRPAVLGLVDTYWPTLSSPDKQGEMLSHYFEQVTELFSAKMSSSVFKSLLNVENTPDLTPEQRECYIKTVCQPLYPPLGQTAPLSQHLYPLLHLVFSDFFYRIVTFNLIDTLVMMIGPENNIAVNPDYQRKLLGKKKGDFDFKRDIQDDAKEEEKEGEEKEGEEKEGEEKKTSMDDNDETIQSTLQTSIPFNFKPTPIVTSWMYLNPIQGPYAPDLVTKNDTPTTQYGAIIYPNCSLHITHHPYRSTVHTIDQTSTTITPASTTPAISIDGAITAANPIGDNNGNAIIPIIPSDGSLPPLPSIFPAPNDPVPTRPSPVDGNITFLPFDPNETISHTTSSPPQSLPFDSSVTTNPLYIPVEQLRPFVKPQPRQLPGQPAPVTPTTPTPTIVARSIFEERTPAMIVDSLYMLYYSIGLLLNDCDMVPSTHKTVQEYVRGNQTFRRYQAALLRGPYQQNPYKYNQVFTIPLTTTHLIQNMNSLHSSIYIPQWVDLTKRASFQKYQESLIFSIMNQGVLRLLQGSCFNQGGSKSSSTQLDNVIGSQLQSMLSSLNDKDLHKIKDFSPFFDHITIFTQYQHAAALPNSIIYHRELGQLMTRGFIDMPREEVLFDQHATTTTTSSSSLPRTTYPQSIPTSNVHPSISLLALKRQLWLLFRPVDDMSPTTDKNLNFHTPSLDHRTTLFDLILYLASPKNTNASRSIPFARNLVMMVIIMVRRLLTQRYLEFEFASDFVNVVGSNDSKSNPIIDKLMSDINSNKENDKYSLVTSMTENNGYFKEFLSEEKINKIIQKTSIANGLTVNEIKDHFTPYINSVHNDTAKMIVQKPISSTGCCLQRSCTCNDVLCSLQYNLLIRLTPFLHNDLEFSFLLGLSPFHTISETSQATNTAVVSDANDIKARALKARQHVMANMAKRQDAFSNIYGVGADSSSSLSNPDKKNVPAVAEKKLTPAELLAQFSAMYGDDDEDHEDDQEHGDDQERERERLAALEQQKIDDHKALIDKHSQYHENSGCIAPMCVVCSKDATADVDIIEKAENVLESIFRKYILPASHLTTSIGLHLELINLITPDMIKGGYGGLKQITAQEWEKETAPKAVVEDKSNISDSKSRSALDLPAFFEALLGATNTVSEDNNLPVDTDEVSTSDDISVTFSPPQDRDIATSDDYNTAMNDQDSNITEAKTDEADSLVNEVVEEVEKEKENDEIETPTIFTPTQLALLQRSSYHLAEISAANIKVDYSFMCLRSLLKSLLNFSETTKHQVFSILSDLQSFLSGDQETRQTMIRHNAKVAEYALTIGTDKHVYQEGMFPRIPIFILTYTHTINSNLITVMLTHLSNLAIHGSPIPKRTSLPPLIESILGPYDNLYNTTTTTTSITTTVSPILYSSSHYQRASMAMEPFVSSLDSELLRITTALITPLKAGLRFLKPAQSWDPQLIDAIYALRDAESIGEPLHNMPTNDERSNERFAESVVAMANRLEIGILGCIDTTNVQRAASGTQFSFLSPQSYDQQFSMEYDNEVIDTDTVQKSYVQNKENFNTSFKNEWLNTLLNGYQTYQRNTLSSTIPQASKHLYTTDIQPQGTLSSDPVSLLGEHNEGSRIKTKITVLDSHQTQLNDIDNRISQMNTQLRDVNATLALFARAPALGGEQTILELNQYVAAATAQLRTLEASRGRIATMIEHEQTRLRSLEDAHDKLLSRNQKFSLASTSSNTNKSNYDMNDNDNDEEEEQHYVDYDSHVKELALSLDPRAFDPLSQLQLKHASTRRLAKETSVLSANHTLHAGVKKNKKDLNKDLTILGPIQHASYIQAVEFGSNIITQQRQFGPRYYPDANIHAGYCEGDSISLSLKSISSPQTKQNKRLMLSSNTTPAVTAKSSPTMTSRTDEQNDQNDIFYDPIESDHFVDMNDNGDNQVIVPQMNDGGDDDDDEEEEEEEQDLIDIEEEDEDDENIDPLREFQAVLNGNPNNVFDLDTGEQLGVGDSSSDDENANSNNNQTGSHLTDTWNDKMPLDFVINDPRVTGTVTNNTNGLKASPLCLSSSQSSSGVSNDDHDTIHYGLDAMYVNNVPMPFPSPIEINYPALGNGVMSQLAKVLKVEHLLVLDKNHSKNINSSFDKHFSKLKFFIQFTTWLAHFYRQPIRIPTQYDRDAFNKPTHVKTVLDDDELIVPLVSTHQEVLNELYRPSSISSDINTALLFLDDLVGDILPNARKKLITTRLIQHFRYSMSLSTQPQRSYTRLHFAMDQSKPNNTKEFIDGCGGGQRDGSVISSSSPTSTAVTTTSPTPIFTQPDIYSSLQGTCQSEMNFYNKGGDTNGVNHKNTGLDAVLKPFIYSPSTISRTQAMFAVSGRLYDPYHAHAIRLSEGLMSYQKNANNNNNDTNSNSSTYYSPALFTPSIQLSQQTNSLNNILHTTSSTHHLSQEALNNTTAIEYTGSITSSTTRSSIPIMTSCGHVVHAGCFKPQLFKNKDFSDHKLPPWALDVRRTERQRFAKDYWDFIENDHYYYYQYGTHLGQILGFEKPFHGILFGLRQPDIFYDIITTPNPPPESIPITSELKTLVCFKRALEPMRKMREMNLESLYTMIYPFYNLKLHCVTSQVGECPLCRGYTNTFIPLPYLRHKIDNTIQNEEGEAVYNPKSIIEKYGWDALKNVLQLGGYMDENSGKPSNDVIMKLYQHYMAVLPTPIKPVPITTAKLLSMLYNTDTASQLSSTLSALALYQFTKTKELAQPIMETLSLSFKRSALWVQSPNKRHIATLIHYNDLFSSILSLDSSQSPLAPSFPQTLLTAAAFIARQTAVVQPLPFTGVGYQSSTVIPTQHLTTPMDGSEKDLFALTPSQVIVEHGYSCEDKDDKDDKEVVDQYQHLHNTPVFSPLVLSDVLTLTHLIASTISFLEHSVRRVVKPLAQKKGQEDAGGWGPHDDDDRDDDLTKFNPPNNINTIYASSENKLQLQSHPIKTTNQSSSRNESYSSVLDLIPQRVIETNAVLYGLTQAFISAHLTTPVDNSYFTVLTKLLGLSWGRVLASTTPSTASEEAQDTITTLSADVTLFTNPSTAFNQAMGTETITPLPFSTNMFTVAVMAALSHIAPFTTASLSTEEVNQQQSSDNVVVDKYIEVIESTTDKPKQSQFNKEHQFILSSIFSLHNVQILSQLLYSNYNHPILSDLIKNINEEQLMVVEGIIYDNDTSQNCVVCGYNDWSVNEEEESCFCNICYQFEQQLIDVNIALSQHAPFFGKKSIFDQEVFSHFTSTPSTPSSTTNQPIFAKPRQGINTMATYTSSHSFEPFDPDLFICNINGFLFNGAMNDYTRLGGAQPKIALNNTKSTAITPSSSNEFVLRPAQCVYIAYLLCAIPFVRQSAILTSISSQSLFPSLYDNRQVFPSPFNMTSDGLDTKPWYHHSDYPRQHSLMIQQDKKTFLPTNIHGWSQTRDEYRLLVQSIGSWDIITPVNIKLNENTVTTMVDVNNIVNETYIPTTHLGTITSTWLSRIDKYIITQHLTRMQLTPGQFHSLLSTSHQLDQIMSNSMTLFKDLTLTPLTLVNYLLQTTSKTAVLYRTPALIPISRSPTLITLPKNYADLYVAYYYRPMTRCPVCMVTESHFVFLCLCCGEMLYTSNQRMATCCEQYQTTFGKHKTEAYNRSHGKRVQFGLEVAGKEFNLSTMTPSSPHLRSSTSTPSVNSLPTPLLTSQSSLTSMNDGLVLNSMSTAVSDNSTNTTPTFTSTISPDDLLSIQRQYALLPAYGSSPSFPLRSSAVIPSSSSSSSSTNGNNNNNNNNNSSSTNNSSLAPHDLDTNPTNSTTTTTNTTTSNNNTIEYTDSIYTNTDYLQLNSGSLGSVLNQHAIVCNGGAMRPFGLFLRLQTAECLLVHHSAIKKVPSPYVDGYGERHVNSHGSRSRVDTMLFLDIKKYQNMVSMYYSLHRSFTQAFTSGGIGDGM